MSLHPSSQVAFTFSEKFKQVRKQITKTDIDVRNFKLFNMKITSITLPIYSSF